LSCRSQAGSLALAAQLARMLMLMLMQVQVA